MERGTSIDSVTYSPNAYCIKIVTILYENVLISTGVFFIAIIKTNGQMMLNYSFQILPEIFFSIAKVSCNIFAIKGALIIKLVLIHYLILGQCMSMVNSKTYTSHMWSLMQNGPISEK